MKKSPLMITLGISLCLFSAIAFADDAGGTASAEPEPRFVLNQSTRSLLDHSERYVTQDEKGNKHLINNHRHVLLARVGDDGKVEMFCADNIHAAEKWAAADVKAEHQP